MHIFGKYKKSSGFTIIELLVVIAVIGILAAIVVVSYTGVQAHARDASVQSDADALDGIETHYSLSKHVAGKVWYSGISGTNGATDSDLDFTPSTGNIIDVVVSSGADPGYCIRIFNPDSATYKTLATAFTKESSPGVCAATPPSAEVLSDTGTPPPPPPPPAPLSGWQQIATGYTDVCGIWMDLHIYCWGYVSYMGSSSTPVIATGTLQGKTFKSISAGYDHMCAIDTNNLGYCWGENTYGQLGGGTFGAPSGPTAVSMSGPLAGKTLKSISVGTYITCAVASDNLAYCWGQNTYGQLGNNTTTDSSVPVAVSTAGVLSGKTIKDLSTGEDHVCAVASDNLAYCWGLNSYGQLGDNTIVNSSVPVAVSMSGGLSGKTVRSISNDDISTCAIASDNLAYCWGNNFNAPFGDGTKNNSMSPVAVNTAGVLSGKTIKAISTENEGSCVIASDDQAYCWGNGSFGKLGNGLKKVSKVPVAVTNTGVLSGKTIKSISFGENTGCVIASDDQAYCWGMNTNGQLGNNATTDSAVPVAVVAP